LRINLKMEYIVHPSSSRGTADFVWLKSRHSFSFGHYYNAERMGFGTLRVLNDDWVAPGAGFGTHPHSNMEIISIALKGDLQHRDSMGNASIIRENEIQVMSAGSGITHSEMNANSDKPVEFLQIWIIPNQHNVSPRYDQMKIDFAGRQNEFVPLIAPKGNVANTLWMHQNAWLSMAYADEGAQLNYTCHDNQNGLYLFCIEGNCKIDQDISLQTRDAVCIWNTKHITLTSTDASRFLILEIPLHP
jgi:redox-sensitive bicupin YhaK (pirin superfamily)